MVTSDGLSLEATNTAALECNAMYALQAASHFIVANRVLAVWVSREHEANLMPKF